MLGAVPRNITDAVPVVTPCSCTQGTHGFTLDPLCGEFLRSHPDITIPQRGQIYSVNDARYHDW
jgi:fructose-1,6-bisphosphatase